MKRSILILILALLVLGGCDQGKVREYRVHPSWHVGGFFVRADIAWDDDHLPLFFDSYAEADSVCRELNERLEERDEQ
jgi:hypothetical protein